jgi:hypothetical protein
MPRRFALLVAFFLLLAAPAGATTLEVTGGVVGISDLSLFEPSVNVTGDNGSLLGFSGQSCCLAVFGTGQSPPFFAEPVTFEFHAAQLILDGLTYQGIGCCDNDSTMTLVQNGEVHPLDIPHYQPSSMPFTMTGHIPLAGGVDLVGQGTLTIERITVEDGQNGIFVLWHFTPVPEPTTLILLALALGGVVVLARLRMAAPRRN